MINSFSLTDIIKQKRINSIFLAAKDALPLMLGLIPFGLAYGVLSRQAGLSWFESVLMSLFVFAGAAQFTAVSMIASIGLQSELIIFTTLLINLRHFLMGASLAPYLQELSFGKQAILSFGMVDESYALTITKFTQKGADYEYQFGANLAIYLAWSLTSAVGAALAGFIGDPLKWGLDFAMPATFIVLLIPQLKTWTEGAVCIVAAVISVLGALLLPGKWYIIIASIVATIVGGGLEKICARKS